MANPQAEIIISAVDKTKAAFANLKKNLSDIENQAKATNAIFSRFLPALGTITVTGFAKSVIDAADGMNDLSQRTGISIDRIAAWDLATRQSGTSVEALAKALGQGSRFLVEHSDELKKLGINATTAEELIFQLSDVISRMPADDPRRTALAMEVLGKSAGDLLPLLSQGSEELRKMVERGAELAQVYKELGPEADTFNDSLELANLRTQVLAARALTPVISRLNETQDALVKSESGWGRLSIRLKATFDSLSLLRNAWDFFFGSAEAATAQTAAASESVEDLNKQLAVLRLTLQTQAAELAKVQDGQILKGYKQLSDATKKQIADFRTQGKEMQSAFIEAGKAAADALAKAKEFQKSAKDARQAGQDKVRQLDAQSQSPQDADRSTNIALEESLDKAKSARLQADYQRLQGNTEEAVRLLDISKEQAQRASDLSDQLNDEGLKRQQILESAEAIARADESRVQVQQKIAATEGSRQDEIKKKMADNVEALAGLESSLVEIDKLIEGLSNKQANIKIENNQDAYNKTLAEIQAIEARLANLSKGVTVPIRASANAATGATDSQGNAIYRDPPGYAGGGRIVGPGSDTSDNLLAWLSPGEYVISAAAARKYGYGFLSQLNSMDLPRYANGGIASRITLPRLPTSSPSSSGMDRGTFVLPSGERLEVHAKGDVFDRLTSLSLQQRKRR